MGNVAQASDEAPWPLVLTSDHCAFVFFTEAPDNLPLIAGSAAAGGITFGIIVIIVVVLFHRFSKNGKQVLSLIFRSSIIAVVVDTRIINGINLKRNSLCYVSSYKFF